MDDDGGWGDGSGSDVARGSIGGEFAGGEIDGVAGGTASHRVDGHHTELVIMMRLEPRHAIGGAIDIGDLCTVRNGIEEEIRKTE